MNAPTSSEAAASDIPPPWRDRALGRSRRGRLIGVAALLVVLAGGGAWAMLRGPVPVRYETAPVVRRDLEIAVSATGKLQPRAYVDVGAQVSGQLEKLHVQVGDLVEPGQLLAEIDAKVQAAQVEGIEADLARLQATQAEYQAGRVFAERQVTRLSRLAAANAASGVTLEEAERDRDVMAARIEATDAEIRRTEASLRAEKLALEHSRILAPMPGIVVAIEAREGQTLNANYDTPLILRIADLSSMIVRSDVSEADVTRLRPGMDVWFTTLGDPDRKWRASLQQVLPVPPIAKEGDEAAKRDAVTYTALFQIANPGGELFAGMTAQVFFVSQSAPDVLAVPLSALDEQGRVRVMDGTGQVSHREIGIGLRTRFEAEVAHGLTEGEKVVTAEIRDGGTPLLQVAP